jgi:capsular polysaccharide biosynthesis protein
MVMDKIDTVMARDVDVNTAIYNNLLQKLETAKITQRLQSSKEGTKYIIIEDARVPARPFSPNKLLVSFMGLFLGLGVGIALLFTLEMLDKSFIDVQEASTYLNIPLLGAISKISTVESIKEEREAHTNLMFWIAVAGILMISLTIMFVNIRAY